MAVTVSLHSICLIMVVVVMLVVERNLNFYLSVCLSVCISIYICLSVCVWGGIRGQPVESSSFFPPGEFVIQTLVLRLNGQYLYLLSQLANPLSLCLYQKGHIRGLTSSLPCGDNPGILCTDRKNVPWTEIGILLHLELPRRQSCEHAFPFSRITQPMVSFCFNSL